MEHPFFAMRRWVRGQTDVYGWAFLRLRQRKKHAWQAISSLCQLDIISEILWFYKCNQKTVNDCPINRKGKRQGLPIIRCAYPSVSPPESPWCSSVPYSVKSSTPLFLHGFLFFTHEKLHIIVKKGCNVSLIDLNYKIRYILCDRERKIPHFSALWINRKDSHAPILPLSGYAQTDHHGACLRCRCFCAACG